MENNFKVGDKVFYNHKATDRDFRNFGNHPENCEQLENLRFLTIVEVMMDDINPKKAYAFRFKELPQWWQAQFFKKNSATQLVFDFAKEK